jgi:hypothetical protein
MCLTLTLDELGLAPGDHTDEELEAAVGAYVLANYGEGAVVNGWHRNCDGTIGVCGTE